MDVKYTIREKAFHIGGMASEAMLYEASCFPSPGLVSSVSKGAHEDMDYFTFLKSTTVLYPYMVRFTEEGFSAKAPKEIFRAIRQIGVEAERAMFEKTNGVNTHKGMIFLLGIACASVGKTIYDKKEFQHIPYVIKEMTLGLVEQDFKNLKGKTDLSHGERLFLKYGTLGVRGEAQQGFPIVFQYALELYKTYDQWNENDRLIHTLIGIMQYCEDTTILHRHSFPVLQEVQQKAKEAMALGGMGTVKGQAYIHTLNEEFIEARISPGGTADLLAVTVFFELIEQYMNKIYLNGYSGT